MLTKQQSDLLFFIFDQTMEQYVCPSYDEMKEHLGLHSKSGVHRLLTALEERGFVRRIPDRARCIEVIRLPNGMLTPGNTTENLITRLYRENMELRERLGKLEAA